MESQKYFEMVHKELVKLSSDEKVDMLYKLLGWYGRDEWFQKKFSEFLNESLKKD
jgi:hypothetical protein